MAENFAAFITSERKRPLDILPAPYTSPSEHEVVIRNRAIGVNPLDFKIQDHEFAPFRYPGILGHECAGEIVEVGRDVTHLRVGDRVLAEGTSMGSQRGADGSFQLYTVVPDHLVAKIPDSMSFEDAAVLPLGVAIASLGLFGTGYLELSYPSIDVKPKGETVVVWGGASSVGSNAIQLATQAGYDVITTASTKNFDYVKQLGAVAVFDYRDPKVVEKLAAALRGKRLAGAFDALGIPTTTKPLAEVVGKSEGRREILSVHPPPSDGLPDGVVVKNAWAVITDRQLGMAIYRDYLPSALRKGIYRPAPEPLVVGRGLEFIQRAIDAVGEGNSARKVVVGI